MSENPSKVCFAIASVIGLFYLSSFVKIIPEQKKEPFRVEFDKIRVIDAYPQTEERKRLNEIERRWRERSRLERKLQNEYFGCNCRCNCCS